jgi:hypothetical protein
LSIFEETPAEPKPEGGQVAEQPVFETPPQESFIAKLVETRGETWSNPEVIAKGKIEADAYIKTLEEQLAAMREDLGKNDYASKLLEQLQSKAPDPTTGKAVESNNNNLSGTDADGNTNQTASDDDLKSLVEKTLTEREALATVEQNLSSVTRQLEADYGTEANAKVNEKAKELGISLSRMEELAKESPSAFFALLGGTKKPIASMAQGSIRTEGVAYQNTNDRDWSYYQKLRRENKSTYYTPKVQKQILEDKKRLGDKFGA